VGEKRGSEVDAGGQAHTVIANVTDGSAGTYDGVHCAWHEDGMAWGN
jgi:hypothetical protein